MKRTILFLILGLACLPALQAQQPLNPGFEAWTTDTLWEAPDSFNTSNFQSYFLGGMPTVGSTTDAHNGNFAAKLSTVISGPDTIAALLSIGIPDQGGFSGGIPYTAKPDSFSFWAKHQVGAGDSAIVMAVFKRQGVMGGFGLGRIGGTASTYTKYSFPISYFMSPGNFPDTVIFLAMTADFGTSPGGPAELIIDDVMFSSGAPQLPNTGFENWTTVATTEPDDWFTLNFMAGPLSDPSVTKSTDSYEGMYAARIESVLFFDDTMGLITNGRLGDDGPVGGLGVTQNPKRLTGYYKYAPIGPDTALAGLFSYHYNQASDSLELVEEVLVKLPAASAYTPFSVDLGYNGWPWIDTLNIAFASSNLDDGSGFISLGSVLLIDSLRLEYYPVGISKPGPVKELFAFPNPASDVINFMGMPPGDHRFELFSMNGSRVLSIRVQQGEPIDVSGIAQGEYLYLLSGPEAQDKGKLKILR